MAPMIDMVFLLLVFFMTVSTLAREARPETDLPVSGTAKVPSEAPPRDVITVMPGDDRYRFFWYNREVDPASLAGLLEESAASASVSGLVLRGPPGLEWKAWKEVLQMLRAAGLDDLIFATFEQ